MSRSPLLVAFVGTATLAGLLAWGVLWQIEDIELPPPPEETQPDVVNRSVDLVGRQGGIQRWRLLAEEASMEGQQQRFDQGANGWFYGNTTADSADSLFFAEQDEIRWFADQAVFNSQQNRLSLRQNVVVSSTDGSELRTDALEITPEEHIDMPEPFTLRGNDVTLTGNSGLFDFAFSALTAYEGKLIAAATEPRQASDNEDVTIVAARLDYDRSTEIAHGEGDLVIQQGSTVINSPRGTFERRESQSSLVGGVTLEEPSLYLRSERMNGDHSDRIFLFEGGVEYRQRELEAVTNPQRSEAFITASQLSHNSAAEYAEFSGSVLFTHQPSQLIASTVELSQASSNEEVTIVADRLDYDRSTEIARGEGDLVIEQGDTVITSPRGTFKRRESQSLLVDGVILEEPSRRLQSERMNGNHRDKIFLFEGGVEYRQSEIEGGDADLQRSETSVDASELIYNSVTERAQFSGPVTFIQRGRRGVADIADITPEMIVLQGNVRIEQIEDDWLRLDDQEVRDSLERPTIIYAERVEIDQRTNDAQFFQEVLIIQPSRAAEGDVATYLDGPQTLALTGESTPALLCDRGDGNTTDLSTVENIPGQEALDVTCRGADRISSSLITLDMANDTFTTEGQSQLQFRLPPDDAL